MASDYLTYQDLDHAHCFYFLLATRLLNLLALPRGTAPSRDKFLQYLYPHKKQKAREWEIAAAHPYGGMYYSHLPMTVLEPHFADSPR
jgi:hypothetical protein